MMNIKLRELILWTVCIFALLKPPDWTFYHKASASADTAAAGLIISVNGACPAGFIESTAMNGKTIIGTIAANGDVGTTGGSDTITPTVASSSLTAAAQTVNALTAAAQPISGSTAAEALHTHSVTSNVTASFSGSALSTHTHTGGTFSAAAQTVNSLTAAAQTVNSLTAAAQTVNSLTAAAQAISGSTAAEAAHTHSVTSNVSQNVFTNPTIAWPTAPTNVPTTGALTTGADSSTTGGVAKAIAQTPTIAWPAKVPAASGGAVTLNNPAVTSGAGTSHLHAFGTLANATSAVTGTMNTSAVTGTMNTSAVTGTMNSSAVSGTSDATSAGTPAGTVPTVNNAVTSGAGSSHLHGAGTLANGTSAVTGTMNSSAVSGTVTLDAFNNRSAYVMVIFCVRG